MFGLIRVSVTVLLVGIAFPTLADDKPTGDVGKFQGSWTGLGGPSKNVPFTVTFAGQKATLAFEAQGQELKIEGEYKLNEKADPKTIDWVNFKNPSGDPVPENLGIYKFDGDKITLCSGGPGNERPKEFKGGEDGPPNLQVITRVAKEKETKDAPKGELAQFQGNWNTKLGELEIKLEIKGNKALASYTDQDGKEAKLNGEIVVNESTKPKSVDFVKFHGSNGEDMQDNMGIYTIDKDTITICLGGPGKERPTEFKSGEDGRTLLTLEKAK